MNYLEIARARINFHGSTSKNQASFSVQIVTYAYKNIISHHSCIFDNFDKNRKKCIFDTLGATWTSALPLHSPKWVWNRMCHKHRKGVHLSTCVFQTFRLM